MPWFRRPLRALGISFVLLIILIFALKLAADRFFPVPNSTLEESSSTTTKTTASENSGRTPAYFPARGEPIGASEAATESPAPLPGGYTNEQLHAFLELEKRKMGIKKILLKGQSSTDQDSSGGDRLPEDEVARRQEAARQWMSQMREQIGRTLEAKESPSVALPGASPALLAVPGGTRAEGAPEDSSGAGGAASLSVASATAESPPPPAPVEFKKNP